MSDWIKTAKVGDRVVCVDTWKLIFGAGFEVGPVAGQEYSIREIGFLHPCHPDVVCVRLNEIRNPKHQYSGAYGEVCFAASRFRPVEPRQTDISIFTDMLKTADKPLEVA